MSGRTFTVERLTHGYIVHVEMVFGLDCDHAVEKAEAVVEYLLQWLGLDHHHLAEDDPGGDE